MDSKAFEERLEEISQALNLQKLERSILELTQEVQKPEIWQDPKLNAKVSQKLSNAQKIVQQIEALNLKNSELAQFEEILVAQTPSDSEYLQIAALRAEIEAELNQLEIQTLFTSQYDSRGALMTIRTGAGGVDAADWSSILQRMYLRWAEIHNYPARILETSPHEEAGIKSTTIEFSAEYNYGLLKLESGTHRLVRQSPFNSAAKRETSFSAVEVAPLIESDDEVQINESDLKIDVFRSSGPGGQSVNTTDSAVRITHLPSQIVVSVQNEKSQLQNKTLALKILKSKLLKLQQIAQEDHIRSLSAQASASWGDQIRNYVLHPYKLVKDLRTNHQTNEVKKVLDGEIDAFIQSELKQSSKESTLEQ
jgi:peptide chain release factor 2